MGLARAGLIDAGKANEVIAAIKDGSLKIFTGPIHDQTGELRVPAGEVMTDQQLLTMDWHFRGVAS